jgi:hypothetical protein
MSYDVFSTISSSDLETADKIKRMGVGDQWKLPLFFNETMSVFRPEFESQFNRSADHPAYLFERLTDVVQYKTAIQGARQLYSEQAASPIEL